MLYGFAFLMIVVLLIAGTVAMYKGVFRSTVPLVVEAPRAGLTLTPGAPVKLRGVEIGTVDSVAVVNGSDGDSVRIRLKIDSGEIRNIPADATAEIVPPTAFGAKYVQLDPGTAPARAIAIGSTIRADKVTVEVDTAFENLTKVLDAAHPAQVDAALTAGAEALDQRGSELGQLISQTNRYLTSFNPLLTTLTADIKSGRRVAATYAAVRPNLVAWASQAGVTSATLEQQQASLHAFELSLMTFDSNTSSLLNRAGNLIVTSLNLYGPVAGVVAKYSPEIPCLVLGLDATNKRAEAAIGGDRPALSTITRIVPARDPYTYSQNLPVVGDTSAPACYGLPDVSPGVARATNPWFKTGANPYVGPQPTATQNMLNTFFGLLSGGANIAGAGR